MIRARSVLSKIKFPPRTSSTLAFKTAFFIAHYPYSALNRPPQPTPHISPAGFISEKNPKNMILLVLHIDFKSLPFTLYFPPSHANWKHMEIKIRYCMFYILYISACCKLEPRKFIVHQGSQFLSCHSSYSSPFLRPRIWLHISAFILPSCNANNPV